MSDESKLTHDQKVRVRRRMIVATLDALATVFTEAGNKNNVVVERMHLEVGALACGELGKMILSGKISDDRVEFLTWLPKPPPPPEPTEKTVKKAKKTRKQSASEYKYDYADKRPDA